LNETNETSIREISDYSYWSIKKFAADPEMKKRFMR
jgi:hypothetical protein